MSAAVVLAPGTGCATRHPNSSSNSALSLPFQEFDQTPHCGWRALAEDDKRYKDAAVLIELYLSRHPELDDSQRAILHFHAGQVLAFAGDNAGAVPHMSSARQDPEPPGIVRWNDYVEATTAFLQKDRARLLAARERMAANSPADPNLPIVESFIANFGASYKTVYAKRTPLFLGEHGKQKSPPDAHGD